MSWPYEDILGQSRPELPNHPRMSQRDRAAQFAPFAALNGFGAMIRDSERQTQRRPPLTEELASALNESLSRLQDRIAEHPRICAAVFVPDSSKPGGEVLHVEGAVRQVDTVMRLLTLMDGKTLPLDDIYALDLPEDDPAGSHESVSGS